MEGLSALLALRVALVGVERLLLRRLGDAAGPAACSAVFFGIGALVLLPFALRTTPLASATARVAVASGLVFAVAYWLYVAALAHGELSRTAPLGSLSSVFVVVFAWWIHGEALSVPKVVGVILIAVGSAALQAESRTGGRRVARWAALAMVGYALLTALTRMLDKTGAGGGASDPARYAFVVFTTVAVCQLGLLAATGRLSQVVWLLRTHPAASLGAGLCNGLSFLSLAVLLTRLPVSVAEPVTALSLLVTAVLAAVVYREPLAARWLPTLVVVVGSFLVMVRG